MLKKLYLRLTKFRRKKSSDGSGGSALIGTIVAIAVMGALGAGMVAMLGTSAFQEVRANHGERAYYLAESGFRYAVSTYNRSGQAALAELTQIDIPEGGTIKFQVEIEEYDDPTTTGNPYVGKPFKLIDGGPGGQGIGHIKNFDNLRVELDEDDVGKRLPRYRGQFTITGGPGGVGFPIPINYQWISGPDEETGYYTLHRITYDDPDNTPLPVTPGGGNEAFGHLVYPIRIAEITSTGSFGSGFLAASRSVTYHWPLTTLPGGTLPDFNPGTPDPGDFISDHDPEERDEETQWGQQPFLIVDDPDPTYQDPDSPANPDGGGPPKMPAVQLCLDPAIFGEAFKDELASKGLLEYDVQVKQKWGWAEVYGATGISFRWQPVTGGHEGYGVSFMRYRGTAYEDLYGNFGDFMPNSMKPHGASWASLSATWFNRGNPDRGTYVGVDINNVHKNLHTLVVLWEQYVEGGHERRRWLAYKDLGIVALVGDDFEKRRLEWFTRPGGLNVGNHQYDEYVLGLQPDWEFDGVYLNDLNTLGVRVEEIAGSGGKENRVKVFYGDASTYYEERNPNTIPYDIEDKRERYLSSGVLLDENGNHYTGIWPVWPPENLGTWTEDDDIFTVIGRAADNQYLEWDDVNTTITGVSWETPDTLVLTRHTSPEGVNNWDENRSEVGLHVFGNFGQREDSLSPGEGEDHEYAAFTDFAIRFVHSLPGGGGEFVPPIQE